ncbi:flavin-containing amine oxidase, putative [Paecilomyces variotii No. 5]|uniref:Flavin-containing amine oxidase, putative n=1 Tax=Byssochlamys spectabilis (strain No. 5 / NBRC 109023) TaxID=1356009 RepID=V5I641_BYSSN|nr:flavin-containing amine oxidase, putative [Paecilomyces variotii No. 5]
MEAASTIKAQSLEDLPGQPVPLAPFLPNTESNISETAPAPSHHVPVPDTVFEMPPAKRRRRSGQNDSFSDTEGLSTELASPFSCPQRVNIKEEMEGASQSTGRASRSAEQDTNHPTPSDSMTSASLFSPHPQNKSASPLTSAQTSFESPSSMKRTKSTLDFEKYRPRSSIPTGLPAPVYAQQCIAAAYASRLNPYALHKSEQAYLQDQLCHIHVTTYLNIRNGILRLWTRNPMVSVTKEEALGCAKDYRWMNLAAFAYDWLVRNGYINFGCVEIPKAIVPPKRGRRREGPVIVVVGAGMSGLGCARQLEALFNQYRDSSTSPRVVVLEGRRRIGGRVYSHPLRSLQSTILPPGLRSTAEMGAQIVVGFDHGNPIDPVLRAQLALRYHLLRDISTIYDIDGSPVDEVRDAMDEKLYNDILDRSGLYRHKAVVQSTAEADRELIDTGRDASADDGVTVKQYEEARAAGTIDLLVPTKRVRRGVGHKTAEIKPAGPPMADLGPAEEQPAAFTCQTMGWQLRDGVAQRDSINLDAIAKASDYQTLGAVMDEGVKQYQRMLPLTPRDMRLLNWHFANLEYANASNVGDLSLSGWDQDMGNEFEGEHAQVIGGYQQVPQGIWSFPDKLNVRRNKVVTKISYSPSGTSNTKALVQCEDGETFAADKVVFTGSLGVLKHQTVQFDPPLPDWKRGAIERLGFGVMNKVILVFEKPFWDLNRDMFGLLREPNNADSMIQEEYSANRGKSYLFWNCMKTSGLPMLVALMAGDAAHHVERTPDCEIIGEVTSQLRNIFKTVNVPDPLETIITRWGTDRFTRGSYSSVAPQSLPGDYDLMAKSVGNLYFAGEATCGTHPATVHGAYISGLRAASEVIESIIGPIEVPIPLVPEKARLSETSTPTLAGQKRKESAVPSTTAVPAAANTQAAAPPIQARSNNSFPSETALRQAYDETMWIAIYGELGQPEPRPAKLSLNPFLLYQKDYWHKCKQQCEDARRASTKNANAKVSRDEIRQALGLMWREASEDVKKPYLDQIASNRQTNAQTFDQWKERILDWERKTYEVKDRWVAANPFETWQPGQSNEMAPPPPAAAAADASTATAPAPEEANKETLADAGDVSASKEGNTDEK